MLEINMFKAWSLRRNFNAYENFVRVKTRFKVVGEKVRDRQFSFTSNTYAFHGGIQDKQRRRRIAAHLVVAKVPTQSAEISHRSGADPQRSLQQNAGLSRKQCRVQNLPMGYRGAYVDLFFGRQSYFTQFFDVA